MKFVHTEDGAVPVAEIECIKSSKGGALVCLKDRGQVLKAYHDLDRVVDEVNSTVIPATPGWRVLHYTGSNDPTWAEDVIAWQICYYSTSPITADPVREHDYDDDTVLVGPDGTVFELKGDSQYGSLAHWLAARNRKRKEQRAKDAKKPAKKGRK